MNAKSYIEISDYCIASMVFKRKNFLGKAYSTYFENTANVALAHPTELTVLQDGQFAAPRNNY